MILTMDQIRARSVERPAGYVEEILGMAVRVTESEVELAQDTYELLLAKYRPLIAASRPPTVEEMLAYYHLEIGRNRALQPVLDRWLLAGAPVASWVVYFARLTACRKCPDSHCARCHCSVMERWQPLAGPRSPICRWLSV